jgi:hypothetical protein
MAYIRRRLGKSQSLVKVKGYPIRTQTFDSKTDTKLWGKNLELELHRDEYGLKKNQ